ncbi:MAG: hypothetical protein QG551_299, partial [Patescibacteria group bacterium]|nr:hypothetical protein [Patescibacteria group bacterium]
KNFFRSDLKLSSKWWHRAVIAIFFILLTLFVIERIQWTFSYDQGFSKVGSLENYISADIVLVSDLVSKVRKEGQVISTSDFVYGDGKDATVLSVYKNTTYCSNDSIHLTDAILSSNKQIVDFYITDNRNTRKKTDIENFKSYTKKINSKCITVDSFSDDFGNKVYFLESLPEIQNLSFYEFSFMKTLGNVFNTLSRELEIFLIFIVSIVVYYKIVLYIIFGKRKINTDL